MNICSYVLYDVEFIVSIYNESMDIIDYCKWRGDIPFSVDPLNYVDHLILSQFTYYELKGIIPENGYLTIEEIAEKYCLNRELDKYDLFLQDLGKSLRFKNIKVHNYVSVLHDITVEQFTAMTFDLPGNLSIISFRGTDDTITGWNEDFELSYKEIEAQKDALEYVDNNMRLFRRYILSGHSKGGNLALYAALKCKERNRRKIDKIISFDGPGLRDSVFDHDIYNEIENKYIKFMPGYGVVGFLFENGEKKTIVKSNERGFLQHLSFSWQVEKNDFVVLDKFEDDSILMQNVFSNFLDKTTEEQREIFVKEIFNEVRNSDINTLSDLAVGDVKKIITLVKNFDSISAEAKDVGNIFLNEFISVYGNNLLGEINNTVAEIVEDVRKNLGLKK